LKINTTLKDLYLGVNEIGDEGAKTLSLALNSNKTLRSPELMSNDIADEGAVSLALALHHNSTLYKLELGYAKSTKILNGKRNHIGDIGAKAFSELLEISASNLKDLNLSDNDIGDVGCLALANGLRVNKKIKTLAIMRNKKIGVKGMRALIDAVKKNDTVTALVFSKIRAKNVNNEWLCVKKKLKQNKRKENDVEEEEKIRQEIVDIRSAFRTLKKNENGGNSVDEKLVNMNKSEEKKENDEKKERKKRNKEKKGGKATGKNEMKAGKDRFRKLKRKLREIEKLENEKT